jgi:hypothetical protein
MFTEFGSNHVDLGASHVDRITVQSLGLDKASAQQFLARGGSECDGFSGSFWH